MSRSSRRTTADSLSHFGAGSNVDAYLVALAPGGEEASRVIEVPLSELIGASWQPRIFEDPERMAELMQSIQQNGLLHPLTVRPFSPPASTLRLYKYEVVAGHRRLEALRRLADDRGDPNTATAPVLVKALSDLDARLLTYTENAARLDLHAWEKANAIASVRDALAASGAVADMVSIGAFVGRSGGGVSEYLRIADTVTEEALRTAGACDANGHFAAALVHTMKREELMTVAKESEHSRPTALRALVNKTRTALSEPRRLDRRRSAARRDETAIDARVSPRYTSKELSESGRYRVNISRPFSRLSHAEAMAYLGNMLPAVAALGDLVAGESPFVVERAGAGVVIYVRAAQLSSPDWRPALMSALDQARAVMASSHPDDSA